MKTKFLEHKFGGRITEISAIGHETLEGVAEWFYIGRVEWSDGSISKTAHISPAHLCCEDTPEAKQEYRFVTSAMSDYLAECGTWHEPRKRNGMVYRWSPNTKINTRLI